MRNALLGSRLLNAFEVTRLLRPLRPADLPAYPARHVPQQAERRHVEEVALVRFPAAHLQDNHIAGRGREGSSRGEPSAGVGRPLREGNRAVDAHASAGGEKPWQPFQRVVAVTNGHIRRGPLRPAVDPVHSRGGWVVKPQHEAGTRRSHHRAADRQAPRAVTYDHIEGPLAQQIGEGTANTPDGPGTADPRRAEHVDYHATGREFVAHPSRETYGEFGV